MVPDQIRLTRLVRAARQGDDDAFRELLELHSAALTSTLVACGVRNAETARDLAQDTALRAWQRLDSLRNPQSFGPWLRQIAANAARDHLRRQAVRREEELELAAELRSEDDPLEGAERRAEVRQMVAALSLEDEGSLALLKDRAEGVPTREMADIMGISEEAVKMRLTRARKRLRLRLQRLRESD